MAYEFRLPDIGEGLHDAEILKWFVAEDDVIQADDAIVEVQTDKAAVEISSPVGGRVLRRGGEEGQVLKVGEVLITLDTGGASEPSQQQPDKLVSATPERTPGTDAEFPAPRLTHRPLAAPAVRKLARTLGIDLQQVVPSDPRGIISRADIEKHHTSQADATVVPVNIPFANAVPVLKVAPSVNTATTQGGERRVPIRGLRKRIYENMARSMYTAPQATGMDEVDVSRLVQMRKRISPFAEKNDIRLTYLPFVVKAVTHILAAHPIFNATVDDSAMEIVYQAGVHIGIATATPEGLLVPVIHDADKKSVFQIAKELEALTVLGRDRKLSYAQLTGSTFTITSTGAHGGWFATPIVNYPEVAILGVHSIARKPVVLPDDSIAAADVMGFSLTFDHRVIDGAHSGEFMALFKELMQNPEALLAL